MFLAVGFAVFIGTLLGGLMLHEIGLRWLWAFVAALLLSAGAGWTVLTNAGLL